MAWHGMAQHQRGQAPGPPCPILNSFCAMCALVLQELCKDGQKGSFFFLAHTPPLEEYQTFLEGNKIVFTLVVAVLYAGGVGYLNWAPQQIISEGGFCQLCDLSPLLFEGKFAPAFPIV